MNTNYSMGTDFTAVDNVEDIDKLDKAKFRKQDMKVKTALEKLKRSDVWRYRIVRWLYLSCSRDG